MKNRDLKNIFFLWLGMLLFLMLPGADSSSAAPLATYPGKIHMDGPLQFDLKVTPPVGTPGDTLLLELSLINLDQVTYTPEINLQLPGNLAVNTAVLPSGATANLQAHQLSWFPVISANGGTQQFTLPLRVETADIARPEQTLTAILRFDGKERQDSTTLWIGIPPQVNGLVIPAQASVGLPVQLRADLSGPGPFAQSWQLGDGRQVDVSNPVVVYPAAGVFDISLTANNAIGSHTATQRITIVPHPTAQFQVDDAMLGVGQNVTFINESGGQQPIAYQWDFGDGATSTDANPSHQYTAPGSYQVSLTIENTYGRSQAFGSLTVGQPPAADMVIDEQATTGQPLRAQATGDETVTAFRWEMGDGRAEEGAQIFHTYSRPGDYYVTMTAVNDYGGTELSRWVHVEPGIMSVYLPLALKGGGGAGMVTPGASLDPLGIVLEPVDLDAPFVMTPLELPAGTSPAEQLFIYINEARRQFDLPPLQYVYELAVAAQQHTDDMAAYRYTGHTGADDSLPAERLLWKGYAHAYAGEATAWGFDQAYQAVEFWINSPGHRAILLNKYATDVGVAYSSNYNAPNVWYWTAEFGNAYGGPDAPALRVQGPAAGTSALNTRVLDFSWNWPTPLTDGQRFTVYLQGNNQLISLGSVTQPAFGTLYRLRTAVNDVLGATGQFEWRVRLEDGSRNGLLESEVRSLEIQLDPDLPTPTPAITPTLAITTTPLPTPLPTVTPTPTYPPATPEPTNVPPPVIVTAPPVIVTAPSP